MTVTKETKKMRKNFLTWLVILLFGVVASVTGCERKESSKNDKPSASAEKKEEEKEPGVVTLSPEKQKAAGIEVQKVVSESLSTLLSATAVIELNADKVSKVSSRVTGKIARVTVSQGDRVKAGQALAYLDTVELDQTCSEYLKAKSRQELALSNLKREETLFEKKVSPEKDVLRARQELSEVEADLLLAKEKFRLLGIDVSQVDLQKNRGGINHPLLPIPSLIDGVVLEKSVIQGEVVSPEKALFTVADLSTLWVLIDLYEQDAPRLKTGTAVKVSVTAFPDKDFRGTLSYIGDVVDEKVRKVTARVTVANTSGILKPGMFAIVLINTKAAEGKKMLAVPEEAVFLDGSERYIFIREGDGRFVVRRVSVGPASDTKIEIKEGLKMGEEVVTKGVFTLKSELKKETLQTE
jgi:cobalt-zinc-cadmium efflux system membrane fusion protein